jgi:hypothetical protein
MSFRFGNFTTTDQLAAVVEAAVGGRDERTPIHPATRTFQVCMNASFAYGHVDRCIHSASSPCEGMPKRPLNFITTPARPRTLAFDLYA